MPNIAPCRCCGSSTIVMDVSQCTIKCGRCGRSVTAPSQRKAAKKWTEDPVRYVGQTWPDLKCGKCLNKPVLERVSSPEGDRYCFRCPVCKKSSLVRSTAYDAMLEWRRELDAGGDE